MGTVPAASSEPLRLAAYRRAARRPLRRHRRRLGTGVGFVIRGGGSCGGDDALALTIAHLTKWRIARAYLLTDITVLVLSLSYIPVSRIVFSLVTVTVSSFLIDFIQSRGACREGAEA